MSIVNIDRKSTNIRGDLGSKSSVGMIVNMTLKIYKVSQKKILYLRKMEI